MVDTAEVVIVGGGIAGCATAYLLAKEGIRSTIIEKGSVGSCASGFSAGLLNPLHGHGIPGPLEELANRSFQMHLHLAEEVRAETGTDIQFRSVPSVYLAFDDGEADDARGVLDLARKAEGFPARWLEGDEVRSMEPRVAPHVVGAAYVEGARQVDSYRYTLALLQAAEKLGAATRHGTVQGIERSRGRVSAVVLSGARLACDKVVLAMGPWTGEAGRWLGRRVPVWPLKGQILRLNMPGPPLRCLFNRAGGGYVSPKPDGTTWVGTTEERVGFDDRPTPEARESIMKEVVEIMPSLAQAQLALQTACLRPASDDGLPVLGEVPGWEGVYVATGAERKGILLGPAMARATADLVATGHTDLNIERFSLGRFAG
jgi:glycine oxidase